MIAQPDIWLCHRNYKKICQLSPIEDLKVYVAANAVDEVTFTLHKNNNGVDFEYWDKIKDLKVICVDGFGYFEIAVDKEVSDDTKKVITGVSIEAELAQITIDGLEINGEKDKNIDTNWDSSGNYIQTVLCNFADTQHSLLHRLLSKAPHWELNRGGIAETITENNVLVSTSTARRTFNFDGTNIYDALQQIAQEFDVVFTFNTVTRTINMYDLNTIGEDTTVYVSTQNLANDFTCSSNKDSIKNCFKLVGGDDIINNAIRAVNPNGTDYIVNIPSEQMEDMSDGLKTQLQKYDDLCEQYKDEYTETCKKMYDAIDEVYRLKTSMSPERQTDQETNATTEVAKLTVSELGIIPVEDLSTLYESGAKKAVKIIAQLKVDYRYEVSFESTSYDTDTHTLTCKFKVENASKTDSAISANDVVLTFVEDEKSSLQSRVDELLNKIDISDDEDIATFKSKLTEYSQDYLTTYENVYRESTKVLEQYSYKDKVEKDLYNFYYSYWEKWQACLSELNIRKEQVIRAENDKKYWEDKKTEYQALLDFETNLGEYYKEFCLYRREDTYQNDNYISDGMNNSELLQNAQKLVEVATKELYKASLFQTVYTANLNNLFTNPIYEPFYDKFDLFNWIHANIDDKRIMLRLIGITYDFSSIESIEVEFSEQVRNANGISDIESILNQSKNMATSYSSTIKQAQNGQEVCLEFDTIKQEGLNSALMNIKNSDNEEVVIDNCGINCRSKDQNDQYDQHELRITGKNLVMTDTQWETARLAIGLMTINYDSDGDGIPEAHEEYGIVADCLIGDMIIGETLLVANSTGTFIVDKDGIIVKNMKLDMSSNITDNRIVIDPSIENMFSLYNGDKKVFYVDASGNVNMIGNLYINNGNTYLKIDMNSENIIEIGVGEAEDIQKEKEEWYKTTSGIFLEDEWVDTNVSLTGRYTVSRLYKTENDVYYIGRNSIILKKYNDNDQVWTTVYNFSNLSIRMDTMIFVQNNKDDNKLYFIGVIGTYDSSKLYLITFDLISNVAVIEQLEHYNDNSYYRDSLSYAFFYDNKLFINGTTYPYIGVTRGGYYDLSIKNEDGLITKNQWDLPLILKDVYFDGDNIYSIVHYIGNGDIEGQIYFIKINDVITMNYQLLKTYSCITYHTSSEVNYGSITKLDNQLYIFITTRTDKNKYDVLNLTTKEIIEHDNMPPVDSGFNNNNITPPFISFVYNNKLHIICTNYNRKLIGYKYYSYYYDIYMNTHYVYDRNRVVVYDKFKPIENCTSVKSNYQYRYMYQNGFIYVIEQQASYYGITSISNISRLNVNKLEDGWDIFSSPSDKGDIYMIPSNSKERIYFGDSNNSIYCINLNDETRTTYCCAYISNPNGIYNNAYIDEEQQIIYYSNWKKAPLYFTKDEDGYVTGYGEQSSDGYINSISITFLSNAIYTHDKDNNLIRYFLGWTGSGTELSLYKTNLSTSSTSKVKKITDYDYINAAAFSIAIYKDTILIFIAYRGVLSDTRYVYDLTKNTVESFNDVPQDCGNYVKTLSDSYEAGRPISMPLVSTDKGVFMFITKPYNTSNNNDEALYRAYLFSDKKYEETQDDVNPFGDKIFFVDKKGNLGIYGNVYAKDGVFKGDIYARSLTLGDGVSLSTSDISGIDDYLNDYVGNSAIITSDDFKYESETLGNGITKVTTTIDGVTSTTYSSESDNYIFTNVGLGNESNTYCKISKDGLLTAKNAIIYGEVHAGAGAIGGWVLSDNTLSSADKTGTNVVLYSTSDFTDNSRPVLLIQKDGVNNYALYSDGYQLVRKLVVENDNGDSVVGKAYFRRSRIDFMSAGTVDLSSEFDNIDTGFTDEGASDGSEEEGSETEEETSEGTTDDPSLWSSVSLRCGFQALSDEDRTSTTSMIFAGCKSNPGELIASFNSSNFWVNAAGGLFTRQITCYNSMYMYLKDNNGKRAKRGVMWFGTTSNYYRFRVGNLGETNSYKNEIDFTKYKTSGKYYTSIQLKARRIDMSTSELISRGTAKVTGTSDEKVKDIFDYTDKYDKFFMNLKPVLYKYNFHSGDEYKRTHCGFGARSVEQAMHDAGLTNDEFGGLCIDKNVVIKPQGVEEGIKYDELYSLDYNEFISLNTYMIQKLYNKIEQLEQKLSEAGIE